MTSLGCESRLQAGTVKSYSKKNIIQCYRWNSSPNFRHFTEEYRTSRILWFGNHRKGNNMESTTGHCAVCWTGSNASLPSDTASTLEWTTDCTDLTFINLNFGTGHHYFKAWETTECLKWLVRNSYYLCIYDDCCCFWQLVLGSRMCP